MKIKTQLNSLVLFICFVFVFTFGLYLIASMPLQKMRNETQYFDQIYSYLRYFQFQYLKCRRLPKTWKVLLNTWTM